MSTMKFTAWQDLDGNEIANAAYPPGLVLIKSQTISSGVSSVTISDVFTDAYDNYKIMISGKNSQNAVIRMNVNGVTGATDYDSNAQYFYVYGGTTGWSASMYASGDSWNLGWVSTLATGIDVNIYGTRGDGRISYSSTWTSYVSGIAAGRSIPTSSTQSSGFTVFPTSGTFSGGNIRVYGYRN
jgi:hypothetical protein